MIACTQRRPLEEVCSPCSVQACPPAGTPLEKSRAADHKQIPVGIHCFLLGTTTILDRTYGGRMGGGGGEVRTHSQDFELPVPFEWVEFTFECFETFSNVLNLHSNVSNPFRNIQIYIWIFWIPFEWFESGLKCSNLHWNASNLVQMVRIYIRILQVSFERVEVTFECFESLSNVLNLKSNASNLVGMVRICIRMLWSWFELLEFVFECFESCLKG